MQNVNIQLNTEKLLNFISEKFISDELDNTSLVQIIEHCGNYLNVCTRSAYAKENNKSYNAAKKYRKNISLFGKQFVIDNE